MLTPMLSLTVRPRPSPPESCLLPFQHFAHLVALTIQLSKPCATTVVLTSGRMLSREIWNLIQSISPISGGAISGLAMCPQSSVRGAESGKDGLLLGVKAVWISEEDMRRGRHFLGLVKEEGLAASTQFTILRNIRSVLPSNKALPLVQLMVPSMSVQVGAE